METSILNTIKKLIGLDVEYTPFDEDIKVFINGAMMVLQQLGVGPLKGFTVTDFTQSWSDFLPSDVMLDGVKQYIYLYVKMAFDPPASSVVMEAYEKQKQELEWRLREQAEFYPGDGSRLGYYEQMAADEVEAGGSIETDANGIYRGEAAEVLRTDEAFRAHGGWYESDPDFPWKDGPAQPAIVDGDE